MYKWRVNREREPDLLREELEATFNARRELGSELEPQLIEGFLEPVGVALGSLGIGIPLTGAAGGTVGFAGVLVVWIGIVLVNFAYALGNRR